MSQHAAALVQEHPRYVKDLYKVMQAKTHRYRLCVITETENCFEWAASKYPTLEAAKAAIDKVYDFAEKSIERGKAMLNRYKDIRQEPDGYYVGLRKYGETLEEAKAEVDRIAKCKHESI